MVGQQLRTFRYFIDLSEKFTLICHFPQIFTTIHVCVCFSQMYNVETGNTQHECVTRTSEDNLLLKRQTRSVQHNTTQHNSVNLVYSVTSPFSDPLLN